MRVRVKRATVVITGGGGQDARLFRNQVVEVSEEVFERHPDWFEVVSMGAPKPQTTQVQKGETIGPALKPKTRRRKRKG